MTSVQFDNVNVENNTNAYKLVVDNYSCTNLLNASNIQITNLFSPLLKAERGFTKINVSTSNISFQNITSSETVILDDITFDNLNVINLVSSTSNSSITSEYMNANRVFLLDGNSTTPSLRFNGDLDTGLYRVRENTMGFTTGGADRLIISNASVTYKNNVKIPVNTAPVLSFSSDEDTGMFIDSSNDVNFTSDSSVVAKVTNLGLEIQSGYEILNNNGTDALPTYTFTSDSNTGIYKDTNINELSISTNGTRTIKIDPLNTTLYKQPYQNNISITPSGYLALDKDSTLMPTKQSVIDTIINNVTSTVNISQTVANTNFNSVAYSPSRNLWIAVGNSPVTSVPNVLYSYDGENWNYSQTGIAGTTLNLNNVIWGKSEFVITNTTSDNTQRFFTSSNGFSWTARNGESTITLGPSITIVANNIYFSVSATVDGIMYTPTISSGWTKSNFSPLGSGFGFTGIAFNPYLNVLCAVTNVFGTGSFKVYRSTDSGVTFNGVVDTNYSDLRLLYITYSSKLRLFVAVGETESSSSLPPMIISNDGLTWTRTGNLPVNNLWRRIYWFDNLGIFYALSNAMRTGSSGNTGYAYSFDGYNWTFVANNFAWFGADYSSIQGMLVTTAPYTAAVTNKNQLIIHTKYNSMQLTQNNAFNNSLTILNTNYQPQFVYGISQNTGNIMDFKNTFRSDNMFPVNTVQTINYETGISASFFGAVLYNKVVFCTGANNKNILEIDYVNNTIVNSYRFPSSYDLRGGILAPNGKIYCVPSNGASIPIFDPITKTFDLTSLPFTSSAAINKYTGAVLAPNGNIYFIPGTQNSILKVNPLTNVITTILLPDPYTDTNNTKFFSGALGPNGKIYCGPTSVHISGLDKIMILDTTNNDQITIGTTALTQSYLGTVLGANGRIYLIPAGLNNSTPPVSVPAIIQEIDPSNDSLSNTINTNITSFPNFRLYLSGFLAQNGRIYMIPFNRSNNNDFLFGILDTNTTSPSFSTSLWFNSSNAGLADRFTPGALLPDGRILITPFGTSQINDFRLLKTGPPTLPPWMLGSCFNKH